MFCSKCGANVEQGKAFCGACGQPVLGYAVGQVSPVVSSAPGILPSPVPAYALPDSPVQAAVAYAGFWLRVVAAIIDGVVLSFPLAPILIIVFLSTFRNMQDLQGLQQPGAMWAILGPKIILMLIVSAIASWL